MAQAQWDLESLLSDLSVNIGPAHKDSPGLFPGNRSRDRHQEASMRRQAYEIQLDGKLSSSPVFLDNDSLAGIDALLMDGRMAVEAATEAIRNCRRRVHIHAV
mmetsp:Transcript_55787/g.126870  ORF Transcript_55787/g.126870 Transcript_55787/m.126870 type:complete len:103 (-) Transcript_55787:19-327(-)